MGQKSSVGSSIESRPNEMKIRVAWLETRSMHVQMLPGGIHETRVAYEVTNEPAYSFERQL